MTLLKQTSLFTEEKLTSSRVVFRANRTQAPEREKAKKMSDTSGRKCLEQLEKFNHVGLWARTFSALLIGQGDWYSTRCKLTWKLRGTKYGRMYCQLQVSALAHTEGIGFGLWLSTPRSCEVPRSEEFAKGRTMSPSEYARKLLPTPTAFDYNSARTPEKWEEDKQKWADKGVNLQMPLKQMARLQMLPTPTAMDSTNATATMKSSQVKEGSMHSVTLTRAMAMGMLPTPMASDCGEKVTGLENQDSLTKRARLETGKTSQLNPRFVLEMMGFPPNWTTLPFLSGETNQSKQPETL
jgi:hypothetical protein